MLSLGFYFRTKSSCPLGTSRSMEMGLAERRTLNDEGYFRTNPFPIRILPILIMITWLLWGMVSLAKAAPVDQELEQKYNQIRQAFLALDKSPQRVTRQPWLPLIDGFKEIYKENPQSIWGEKSMFMVGRIYYLLFQRGGMDSDLDWALDHFSRVINNYPQSPLVDDALFLSAEIYFLHKKNPEKARQTVLVLIKDYPKGDMRKKAEELLPKIEKSCAVTETDKVDRPKGEDSREEQKAQSNAERTPRGLPQITGMRHWSTPQYTRIVVDVDDRISYRQKILKKDPSKENTERLYLDLYPARLAGTQIAPLTIQDGLLKSARIGQFNDSTVRLVLDIESVKGYKVFFLENPFRLIVDVSGKEKQPDRSTEPPGRGKKLSLAQQLGLGVKRIIIDAGHGGKDTGAIGKKNFYEKKLTLKIAKKLAQKIQQDLKLETLLTRGVDCFIPLEERTAIANTKHADLFISIHINASPNPQAEGIETYFLNLATDEESIRVAARENATSTKRISDMQKILKDLMLNTKIDESSRLAAYVQQSIVRALNEKYSPVKNLGVKQAPFYVLIGARMPAILVEVSFISNDRERERLNQEDYLDQVVEGLVKGIDGYIKEIKLAGTNK
ncbi:MAG: N-acetylmuramoyl-L-alanine amidase [Desulfobacca sp.]|nr:N-acetylmuramoyl-L-alanine amidase [Desulfobacca sp.]